MEDCANWTDILSYKSPSSARRAVLRTLSEGGVTVPRIGKRLAVDSDSDSVGSSLEAVGEKDVYPHEGHSFVLPRRALL